MLLNYGVGEDSESPLDCKEIQPVHPKGDQSWVFIGRTDVEAETPILWSPDVKSWLIGKDPDAWKDWEQEEKGTTEDEMVRWHHRLSGHEFGWTPGVADGQGGLARCSSWGSKELDTTEQLTFWDSMIRWKDDKLYFLDKSLNFWTLVTTSVHGNNHFLTSKGCKGGMHVKCLAHSRSSLVLASFLFLPNNVRWM